MRRLKWDMPGVRYVVCDDGEVPISVHVTYYEATVARGNPRERLDWTIHRCSAVMQIEREDATPPVTLEKRRVQVHEINPVKHKQEN